MSLKSSRRTPPAVVSPYAAIRAHLKRGDMAEAFQNPGWTTARATELPEDSAAQLLLIEAGHARLVEDGRASGKPLPNLGITALCDLLHDRALAPLRTWQIALATPSDNPDHDIALTVACFYGHGLKLLPDFMATHARQRLAQIADHLESTLKHDAAATTLLRLARVYGDAPMSEPGVAVALCERALGLAHSPEQTFKIQVTRLRWQLRAGLIKPERLTSQVQSLSEGQGPVSPGTRARLVIDLATPLLEHHAMALDWVNQGALLAAQNGQPLPAFHAIMTLANHHLAHGDASHATRLIRMARSLAETMKLSVGRCSADFLAIQAAMMQGQHDRALMRATQLDEALRSSHALFTLGAPLATLLAQLGACDPAHHLLDYLAARLQQQRFSPGHAELHAARASCAAASQDLRGALRHHRAARLLYAAQGDTLHRAEQSLAFTQVAFVQSQTNGSLRTAQRAHRLAFSDCAAVPATRLHAQHAALAQIDGQLRLKNRDIQGGLASLREARDRYAAAADPINAGFVEALRGLALLEGDALRDPEVLNQVEEALCWAQQVFEGHMPHAARTMLFYRALAHITHLEASTEEPDEAQLDHICSLLRICHDRIDEHAQSNPLTFDLLDAFNPGPISLQQRIRDLIPRLTALADDIDCPQLDDLHMAVTARAPTTMH